jgi:cyclopropane-fatty-acyl-phospholipid synthase
VSARVDRQAVLALLRRIRRGRVELVDGDRRLEFGDGDGPAATVTVRSPAFYRQALRGSLGLGDSYARGDWDCDDLVALVRVLARNMEAIDRVRRRVAPVLLPVQRLASRAWLPTPARSRRQIAAHYDLGNDFFELFLDETMTYSCAVFDSPGTDLADASRAKLERVCAKLDVQPRDHVLEIGTGWGSFALHAATTRGCRVTTTTLSKEQHDYARKRIEEAGLSDRVELRLDDYRHLAGRYDKLVSIEMIEAVGWQNFGTFFRRCSDLLKSTGALALQAITIDDRAYDLEKATRSFIKARIFPGGALPSVEVMTREVARRTDMRAVHLEDITPHYPPTLAEWRRRLLENAGRLLARGYPERLVRQFELYFAYCEAGFRERRIGDVQLVLAKPEFRGEQAVLEGARDAVLAG